MMTSKAWSKHSNILDGGLDTGQGGIEGGRVVVRTS